MGSQKWLSPSVHHETEVYVARGGNTEGASIDASSSRRKYLLALWGGVGIRVGKERVLELQELEVEAAVRRAIIEDQTW